MEATQYSDVHSLDGIANQIMGVSLEENMDSSFAENVGHSLNAEIVAGMFEYLPGCVNGAQEILSAENSGMGMLIYPRKYKSSPSSQEEIAAKRRLSEHCAKFEDLDMCDDNVMLVEDNTGKSFADIVLLEATPEHEEFIKMVASESSETILVPRKCESEHSTHKIYSWDTIQLEPPVVLESLQLPNDHTDDFENARHDTCTKCIKPTHSQLEENINKHYEVDHHVNLVRGDNSSKQPIEEHDEGFPILGANEPDGVTLLQSEENTNMRIKGEHCVNMGVTAMSSKQHTDEYESNEFIILGAESNPDLDVIQAYHNENVDQSLHVSLKGDAKTDKSEEIPEKQIGREEQCISFNVSDNASKQYNEERINDGKLSILKSLNEPDGGIRENLKDGQKPNADTKQPLSIVFEGGADTLQKAYSNSNEYIIGDLVWAKVRSHPWWPAQVFDPAHASESAKKREQSGRVLIAFFGDRTFAWLQKSQLIAFQPNFKKKVKQTNTKTFCKGVAEALEEFCKISELGLICQHYKGSLSTSLNGQSDNGNGVNVKRCKISHTERIQPAKTLEFIKCTACNPFGSRKPNLEAAELLGHAYGFRACMVALSTTDFLQNMQVVETLSVHRNQQKRKSAYVELDAKAGVEAKEVKKKVKTSDVKKMEKEEDVAGTLLALACYHPKLLKMSGKERSRKDLQCLLAKKDCRQMPGQGHDSKLNSGSKSSKKVGVKAATSVCGKRRKKSKVQDVFSFTPSESEENLSEAGMKVPKRRKKSSNATVPMPTRSKQSEDKRALKYGLDSSSSPEVAKPRVTMVNNPDMQSMTEKGKRKGNRLSCLGYSIRKVAIELTGTPPSLKCVDESSKKISKFRSKKKLKKGKTTSSSKHDKGVFQVSPLDECNFSTVQLHQSLKILARDPLNKADMSRPPSATVILLRFRAEFVKRNGVERVLFDDAGTAAVVSLEGAQIEVEDTGEAVRDVMEYDQHGKALDTSSGWNASREDFSQAAQKVKQIMFEEADNTAKDALEGDQISKVLETSVFLNEDSSQAARKGKQIMFEEAGDTAKYALETIETWNELPNEHSKDSSQAAWKGKSKVAQEVVVKSSRKCSTSSPRGRLDFPALESREPIDPRPFENNEDPFPGGSASAASNTRSFSQRNYNKLSAPLQLGIFIRFPPNFSLPSEAQLKAMFVQFGPVQLSGVRVFKELASAQVVFTHGEDAKIAYKHVKKTAMFGHTSVTYKLRQFAFSDNWKETRAYLRGSSSRVHERVPSLEHEHATRCLEMATSLKDQVNEHLRAASESSRKRTKNGQANRTSMQHSRNGTISTNRRSSALLGDMLQERMMTLLRRVSVIVGTPNVTHNTK